MNKTLLSFVVGILLLAAGKSYAVWTDAWTFQEVTANSETFKGPLYVSQIWLSSPTTNTSGDFAVLLASPTNVTPGQLFSDFSSDAKKSPALVYNSTTSVNSNVNLGSYLAIDYGEPGIFISTDASVYKSKASSGEALKAFIKYRR